MPGDAGVMRRLDWPSTVRPLSNMGPNPVFCDIDPASIGTRAIMSSDRFFARKIASCDTARPDWIDWNRMEIAG